MVLVEVISRLLLKTKKQIQIDFKRLYMLFLQQYNLFLLVFHPCNMYSVVVIIS